MSDVIKPETRDSIADTYIKSIWRCNSAVWSYLGEISHPTKTTDIHTSLFILLGHSLRTNAGI